MIDREHKLPLKRQCELLGVARSTAYYRPEAQPVFRCMVVVGLRNERLSETPAAVLASLDGDLQHALSIDSHQVVLRLVSAVLN